MKPRLLDLFCGAGGTAGGYHRAGFDVVGVDSRPMPRFPFEFHQADALEFVREHGHKFDVIHASPPCQAYAVTKHLPGAKSHPDLVGATRSVLEDSGRVFVIENVVGSPLINPTILCGSMFGLAVRRHRLFESNRLLLAPGPCRHNEQRGTYPAGRARSSGRHNRASVVMVYGGGGSRGSLALWSGAMGIDWMTMKELTQAIPPAYCEFLGRQLINFFRQVAHPLRFPGLMWSTPALTGGAA